MTALSEPSSVICAFTHALKIVFFILYLSTFAEYRWEQFTCDPLCTLTDFMYKINPFTSIKRKEKTKDEHKNMGVTFTFFQLF